VKTGCAGETVDVHIAGHIGENPVTKNVFIGDSAGDYLAKTTSCALKTTMAESTRERLNRYRKVQR